MQHPGYWRQTIEPFSLPFHTFTPLEILGYPHAGNDVFHILGRYRGKTVRAYLKVARQKGADIPREVALLTQTAIPLAPQVLDYGLDGTAFILTGELPGQRLSVLLRQQHDMALEPCLRAWGQALSRIHKLTPPSPPVADRRFFHPPTEEACQSLGLSHLTQFFSHPLVGSTRCFCHGDFHYANILWQDSRISGILDFELSGYGDRDFDLAWAMFPRPGQEFLRTRREQMLFLAGYGEEGQYDLRAINHYLVQIGTWFLRFC